MFTPERPTLLEPSVLVIEDDASIATLVSEVLRYGGYHTRVATNGTAALEMLAEYQPSLILMDLYTPGLAWYETIAQLKHYDCATVPIIVMTGASDVSEVKASPRIASILHKPFELNDLLTCVAHNMLMHDTIHQV